MDIEFSIDLLKLWVSLGFFLLAGCSNLKYQRCSLTRRVILEGCESTGSQVVVVFSVKPDRPYSSSVFTALLCFKNDVMF